MKKHEKAKYTEWQNTWFMLKCAWKSGRMSVPLLCLVIVAVRLSINLTELFLAPQVLARVETHAPLGELLGTIGGFCAGLFLLYGLFGYLNQNKLFGRIDVRTFITRAMDRKGCETSYPNTRDPQFLKLRENAHDHINSNQSSAEHIWETLTEVLLNLLGFAVYLTLLANLNALLIAVVLVSSVLGFFISRRINDWGYRHREERADISKSVTYAANHAMKRSYAKDIRIFGLGQWLRDIHESGQRMLGAFLRRRERVYVWATVVDTLVAVARNGIAYLYLIRLALDRGLPASQFLLYFAAVSGFSSWVTGILKGFATLRKESLGISIIREYLDYSESFRFQGGRPVPQSEGYELRLEDVTFRYPGSEKNLFEHLNLTVHPGEKLAVVGLNGAGKTTLVKLLSGFYDPTEGRVLCNGIDIREFNRQEYYAKLSAVFQEYDLLQCTIAENVAQDYKDIDERKVRTCLDRAGLTEFIETLPQGIETHVGRDVYYDGVLFSGGQTQRLMLARALYKEAPILMLDEPTAALDPIAENDIYRKYNDMTAGKTSLFISHRLASTRFCDRIIYLANGKVAEEGTHEALLKMGGGYADLFEVQSRYYREGREF
ncbi:MAG: ABC transporter ATP-binding protein [Eubacteriales bacterium]|nr:ABC transporter ATP-binding protein [Eubacteriales bacterium]